MSSAMMRLARMANGQVADHAPGGRAQELFDVARRRVHEHTDRLFAGLMIFQWIAGIAAALWLSPRTWAGAESQVHPHVLVAIFLGGAVNLFPAALALWRPGRTSTRYVVATGQALTSALLIHLSGGRIETHFHVFGSLAFLSFYRDWRVLVPATLVTAADHFLRGAFYPQSVYGVAGGAEWRWLEHAGWVIFEDLFLVTACVRNTREMWQIAERTAEAERRTTELTATCDTALDCIITTDADGRVTGFNPAAERTLGFPRAAVLGRPLADAIIPSALRPTWRAALGHAGADGQSPAIGARFETRALRADGSEFPAEAAVTCVSPGGRMGFVVYLRDITDAKRAEAAARTAEKLALVASRTDNAVVITDTQGRVEWVNEGFIRITGYTLDEVLGRKPGSFLQGPESDPTTIARIRDHVARGEAVNAEIVNYGKTGRKYWLAIEIQPVREANGAVRAFVAIESDITQRKLAEAALRESESRFQRMAANVPGMVFQFQLRTDGSINFPFISEGCREVFGLEPEAVQQDATVLLSRLFDADRASFQASVAKSAATLVPCKWEGRFYHADGSVRWVNAPSRPQAQPDGSILWDGMLMDVTARKAAEEELHRAKEAAEQARAAAEQASRAKSEFLANMSHEIRTPLNGVIGMTDVLTRKGLSEQQLRYAQVIKSSANALLSLINDILDFSKIEAGKLELEAVDFDLKGLVEEVVEMMAQKAAAKGLELACQIDCGMHAEVRGDANRLRQILLNLINNALKFTEKGQVIVRAACVGDTDADLLVRFNVEDTGIGIPPDRMDRLFQSFSQVDASTTRKYGGTGLGLAICKQLAELMGGQIGVESVDGRGSTFWFTARLPKRRPSEAGTAAAAVSTTHRAPHLRGLRVLAVDDNPACRDILRDQLAGWGFDVAVANDGATALELLRGAARAGRPYRVALVDMVMPQMSGPDMARVVRADATLSETRLLMLTSMDNPFDAGAMQQIGFLACLTKPVRQSQLFDRIAEAAAETVPSPGQADFKTVAAPSAMPGIPDATGDGARILLVEDNDVNRLVAQEILEMAGHRCTAVNDGAAAVAAVARAEYDVVLMDCQMPGMDGFEATRRIRVLERDGRVLSATNATRLPIIALTANAIRGDRERCLAAGMDHYVSKPIDPDELLAAIASLRSPPTAKAPAAQGITGETGASDPAEAIDVPPIDVPALLRRCRGKGSLVEKLLNTFRDQIDGQMESVRQELDRQDVKALARLAHTIKGTAANLSAEPLRDAAAALEAHVLAGELEAATACARALADEVRGCVDYLPAAVASAQVGSGA